ncbi:Hsp70 family protein [uncultured Pseudodesulfovibrio sp.]|uniref:Hsp70 family protein n=1 Tax=uncultured Pseudodesulfovibrio sp. TaxID=2035858 RepID=UPI0029C67379|nr:Hsp70 family protein [uncultured Pseudodesulfovibrio sp.]
MRNYIGIDLGTTNSAICSYDGSETRIWKSPQQNDVTPSYIYIDRRGNKQIGYNAYNMDPISPDNTAKYFKRLMGTSTPVNLSAVDVCKTPEECSAEILKVLYGYLPEEIRITEDSGTVITVPAAFNQMQKDATMQAARMAGIGNVALMQEPVAAVMSVIKSRNTDGMFLIYDLGGGTLDIAIAECIGGRVNLLAHGGIAMCGGRDFDRVLVDNVVRPWLYENFDLPEGFSVDPNYNSLMRLATWATERSKIELSAKEESVISLSEAETRMRDISGNEIYLDIPLQRKLYDELIAKRVEETIVSARDTLQKAGLSPYDLERVVFVGGPTNYKPLRDKVASELGIPGSTDVNPMTAVAEGASLFAESIDWSSQNRSRKDTRGQILSEGELTIAFNYISRTPDVKAKIAVQVQGEVASGSEFQIDSIDTGWTSGRMPLVHAASIEVSLPKTGENQFKISAVNHVGSPIELKEDVIVITRTAATVDAIPASHSIGVEVLNRLGGQQELEYIIRSGDLLPKKGKVLFKAAESLKAGSADSLNFALWEGDIEDNISDNRHIGVLKISGSDFDDGVIPAGADLECDFEILDSGNIVLEVSVPCIGGVFHSGKNFYSRQEAEDNYANAPDMIIQEAEETLGRINEINDVVENPKLDQARDKIDSAVSLDPCETEAEKSLEAREKILEVRRLLAQVRKEHRKEIRQIDLYNVTSFFEDYVRQYARPSEISSFNSLVKSAERSISHNDHGFENHLSDLKGRNFEILWRQDWFVVDRFKWMAESPHQFADKARFEGLVAAGTQFMRGDDIEKLRDVVAQLSSIQIGSGPDNEMLDVVNILRG